MLSDAVEGVKKTSQAVAILKKIGALADVEKSKDSKALRAGKGGLSPCFRSCSLSSMLLYVLIPLLHHLCKLLLGKRGWKESTWRD